MSGYNLLYGFQGRTTSYLAATAYIPKVAARSWRWGPEMREAASTLGDAGLPPDLAEASALVMSRWADLKDSPLDIPQALHRLHSTPDGDPG
ncbi:DUF1932 domain-containing protein [Streptomyces sp. NBC_01615]|uniref:DUF1932 domain-containing protein n=1 Tax=Streptomyces sp. NBC_01615 TaxID=2975898 RepID=UPI00386D70D8